MNLQVLWQQFEICFNLQIQKRILVATNICGNTVLQSGGVRLCPLHKFNPTNIFYIPASMLCLCVIAKFGHFFARKLHTSSYLKMRQPKKKRLVKIASSKAKNWNQITFAVVVEFLDLNKKDLHKLKYSWLKSFLKMHSYFNAPAFSRNLLWNFCPRAWQFEEIVVKMYQYWAQLKTVCLFLYSVFFTFDYF